MLLSDPNGLVRRFLQGADSSSLAHEFAARFSDVSPAEIEADLMDVANEIVSAGLCRADGDVTARVHEPSVHEMPRSQAEVDEDFSFTGEEFYRKNGLLPELHVDLTDACSERCVHCYVPQGQHDYLPFEICEKALREFREQQGLTVQLTGGECMLHPDFAKICRLCRALDLNFIVMSNLTLCDERTVAVLKETAPQFVNVSLYSMDEREHDAITQVPGSGRKTRAAIDALLAAGVPVRLATPLLKANQAAYPALRRFAEERRLHLIPDCDIIPRCGGDCSNLGYACSPEEVERVLAGDKAFWDRGYGKNPNVKPTDKVCDIGELLSLNSRGLYYPCSGMHEYVVGDARETSLADVWRGEKMSALRRLTNADFPQCAGCAHRAFCKVCPAFNFNATGSLFKTIPAKCAVSAAKHRVYGGE